MTCGKNAANTTQLLKKKGQLGQLGKAGKAAKARHI